MTDYELNVKVESFCGDTPCDDMQFHLKQYHPGIPGYALKYDYFVTFKGEKLAFEDYDVDFNLPMVWIIADRIVIPDEIRQRGEILTITVTHKEYKEYRSTIHIKMRKYELTLEDNFENFNTDLWEGMPYGAKTPLSITPVQDNYVKDGKLCLEFKKLDKPIIKDGKEYWYTDAGVRTKGKFSQKYGCFTAKCKHPSYRKGLFTAFWLMPEGKYCDEYFFKRTDTGNDFHGCSEIDIMEIFCHPDTLGSSHTEHYWEPGWDWATQGTTKSSLGENYIIPGFKYGEYQEYSCVWNEYAIYYYVNGELARANTNIAPVDDVKAAYIKFACYIGPKDFEKERHWCGVPDELLPQEFVIDWLKVYK